MLKIKWNKKEKKKYGIKANTEPISKVSWYHVGPVLLNNF